MSRVPIKAAKELANKTKNDIVIVFAYNEDGTQSISTWGRSKDQCSWAADFGNKLKEKMGWPESLCNAQPSRVRRLQKRLKETEDVAWEALGKLSDHYETEDDAFREQYDSLWHRLSNAMGL